MSDDHVQQVIDVQAEQNKTNVATFNITTKPNATTSGSLDASLLAPSSPHDTNAGTYWNNDSLNSDQVVKPASLDLYRRKSTLRDFIEQKQASIFSSCMNLSNTILGAGLLGLPYAISRSGYILAFLLFIIMGMLSSIGLNLAMSAAKIAAPNASYYTLSEMTVPRAKKLVDLAVAIKCFGVGTSYFVVVGDLMPDVLKEFLPDAYQNSVWTDRHLWITILSLIFIFPVIRFKQMDALRFTSIIAVICFAYVTIIVILFAFGAIDSESDSNNEINNGTTATPVDDSLVTSAFPKDIIEFLVVIPVYIFAFTCHQNAFTITNELKNNISRRLNMVIGNSLSLCITIYCIVGYCGYFTYGDNVEDDILKSYPQTVSVAIVRIALSIALAWSYPLQCHPCRKCLASLFWDTTIDKLSTKKFYILTYSIAFGSFIISMIVSSLGVVLEIVGSTGSPIISFILPGMFYYYMTTPKLKYEPFYEIKRRIAFGYIVFGCLIIPFALTMVIYNAATE